MNWKKIALKLLYPHIALILSLLPLSVAFLIYSLVFLDATSIMAIISYVLSFYLLTVICLRIPNMVTFFKKVKNENKFLRKFFSDESLRVKIALYLALIFNVSYAVFQFLLGIFYNSLWFYSTFAYYIILGGIRYLLFNHTTKYQENEEMWLENKKYLFSAWLLLIMNVALMVIVIFVVKYNRALSLDMITTIALAAYTFLTLAFAIVNLVKSKRYNSPVFSAIRSINFIASVVSIFTLEATMLTTFGQGNSAEFRQIMLSLTGAIILGIALFVSINMIIKGKKKFCSIFMICEVDDESIRKK